MERMTIDYGIDLGTTNSEIAVFQEFRTEIFRNNEGFEYTPSVVWIDSRGRTRVGQQARDNLEEDPENAAAEFKLLMGTSEEKTFQRSGRKMKPEELSAQVLMELKRTVKLRNGEDVEAAVITVPAAFELPQADATRRAAQLAGFSQSPLVQEPVAAALTYGFQSAGGKAYWLVYDLGGGTFDAALIRLNDGVIQVVNHGGDNHLGGKWIDWAIIDELLVPAVRRELRWQDFSRRNPKCRSAIAKLKMLAEKAKIRLSANDSVEIMTTLPFVDAQGNWVNQEFEYEMNREDVEGLAKPLIDRSLEICKRVLAERRFEQKHIERVILVGGPTNMPFLRERLESAVTGLGIPLDHHIDPVTAVARGAALFAGTQRLKRTGPAQTKQGEFAIELDYSPVGPDHDPLVGGKVLASDGEMLEGYALEIVNKGSNPPWRSGKISLNPDGSFLTSLWAEKGRNNTFTLELSDPSGKLLVVSPGEFSYSVGTVITEQPLIHSVGVARADNTMRWFFTKGSALPLRRREMFKTTVELRPGSDQKAIRIPVVEGDFHRADRNNLIGMLEITGERVSRTVPTSSEVEVTLEIDESRVYHLKAYIAFVDEEFELVLNTEDYGKINVLELQGELDKQKERMGNVLTTAKEAGVGSSDPLFREVESGGFPEKAEKHLELASEDSDAALQARELLRELTWKLDELEDAVKWPASQKSLEEKLVQLRKIAASGKDPDILPKVATLEAQAQEAIQSKDPEKASACEDRIQTLILEDMEKSGVLHPMAFLFFLMNKDKMKDQKLAQVLIEQGKKAMQEKDSLRLRFINSQLAALLPNDVNPPQGFSTIQ